jgi:hypothetical protein
LKPQGRKKKLLDLDSPYIETIEATGTLITDGKEVK